MTLRRNGTKTHLVLDNLEEVVLPDATRFRSTSGFHMSSMKSSNKKNNKPDLHFGNVTSNSDVYIGGLPSWYSTKLSSLALPSVVFETRFKGAIRNVVYADDASGRPTRQEVMAYKVRPKPGSIFTHLVVVSFE